LLSRPGVVLPNDAGMSVGERLLRVRLRLG
jgi:hypothetical protein